MIHEPEVLDEVGQVFLAELETMPLAELDRLIKRVTAAKEAAREYEQFLQATLNHRFSERAQELRRQAGKTTGVVRLEEDGYVVIADLPKKPEYDQGKLRQAVEALRKWGENPEDYVCSRSRSPRPSTTRGRRRSASSSSRRAPSRPASPPTSSNS